MPLDANNPARAALIFDGLDGAVGSMCGNSQVFSRLGDSLVVAAVNCPGQTAIETSEHAARLESSWVLKVAFFGFGWEVRVAVGHGAWMFGFQVLDQGALLVDVEDLAAETVGQ